MSPQFHLKFDDNFQTAIGTKDPDHGIWKKLASLTKVEMDTDYQRSQSTQQMTDQTKLYIPTQYVLTNQDRCEEESKTVSITLANLEALQLEVFLMDELDDPVTFLIL